MSDEIPHLISESSDYVGHWKLKLESTILNCQLSIFHLVDSVYLVFLLSFDRDEIDP